MPKDIKLGVRLLQAARDATVQQEQALAQMEARIRCGEPRAC